MKRTRTMVFLLLPGVVATSAALILFTGCASNGDWEEVDASADMSAHPRRSETPALLGDSQSRVRPARLPVIHFDAGRWTLTRQESAKIARVAAAVKARPERLLIAAGATAESDEYARQLGELRAQTVKSALVDAGVLPSRIVSASYGEDAPGRAPDGVSFSYVATGESDPGR